MPTLILFSCLCPLLIRLTIQAIHQSADDVIVVDLDDNVHKALKEYRISSVPIRVAGNKSWAERDRQFKELCLPGEQLGFNLPTTDLPTWKMVSLDRLSFWFRGLQSKNEFETLMMLNWDTAIVVADIAHPLPWSLARYSQRPITAAKNGSFRTREWYDLLSVGGVPFNTMVVDRESDKAFLEKYGYKGTVKVI